jgi:hypothetical protein
MSTTAAPATMAGRITELRREVNTLTGKLQSLPSGDAQRREQTKAQIAICRGELNRLGIER